MDEIISEYGGILFMLVLGAGVLAFLGGVYALVLAL
jgi:hypothetical protein